MKITEVTYEMAAPASRLDVIKYALSNGRYGKLFVSKTTRFSKFWADQDPRASINCRCLVAPVAVNKLTGESK